MCKLGSSKTLSFTCRLLNQRWTLQGYRDAVVRAVEGRRAAKKGAHVLDLGCGTGFLSAVASASGADSVTACDLNLPMTSLTQRVSRNPAV